MELRAAFSSSARIGRRAEEKGTQLRPLFFSHNSGYLIPCLDLVFVRMGDGPYPSSVPFEKELVKGILAAVEK